LKLAKTRLSVVDVNLCVGCQCCMFACSRRFGYAGLSKTAILIRSAGGIERGFVVQVCRACENPPCAAVCPTNALKLRSGGGVLLEAAECVGCKLCINACAVDSVLWDDESDKPMICVHCGLCAQACPYGVLELSRGD